MKLTRGNQVETLYLFGTRVKLRANVVTEKDGTIRVDVLPMTDSMYYRFVNNKEVFLIRNTEAMYIRELGDALIKLANDMDSRRKQ